MPRSEIKMIVSNIEKKQEIVDLKYEIKFIVEIIKDCYKIHNTLNNKIISK